MLRLLVLRSFLLAAICLFGGCPHPKVPESTIQGSSYNWYKTATGFEPFKADLLSWAEKSHFAVVDSRPLRLSKKYAPKCTAVIWIDGDTKGLFKLMESVDFSGAPGSIASLHDNYKDDSTSLFEAMKAYYVTMQ